MTKNAVIEKTLREIGPRTSKYDQPFDESPDEEEIIVAEINLRLPDTDIKTCVDFQYLNVSCCDTCHNFYPHYEMSVIVLPDGATAWVCDPLKEALTK